MVLDRSSFSLFPILSRIPLRSNFRPANGFINIEPSGGTPCDLGIFSGFRIRPRAPTYQLLTQHHPCLRWRHASLSFLQKSWNKYYSIYPARISSRWNWYDPLSPYHTILR